MTGRGDRFAAPHPDDAVRERAGPAPRPRARFILLLLLAAIGVAGFGALGVWQVQRLGWKHDLIARVDARVRAAPVAAPIPSRPVTRSGDEYRHVALVGRFLADRRTLVDASTTLGPGDWVMAPFADDRGFTILVNRGFVPNGADVPNVPAGPIRVTGLLRISEPGGRFLRDNDPAADRWYSRDVAAIAQARDLGPVAGYFVDADRGVEPTKLPVGGLTVVSFPNNHLVYALTWFALSAMSLAALLYVVRDRMRPLP